jgi:tetratricopeptide (TPR) repeat protein
MNGTTSNWWYRARDAFESAIELDPEFADAHAGLAYIYARFNFYDEYMPAAQARPRSERAIRKALALDPTAVDAYFARAILAGTRGEYASAGADLDRALQLSPNSSTAHFLYSEVWLAENQPDNAIAAARRALDIDPLSPWVNVNMAIVLFSIGQWEQAMTAVDHAIEIDPGYTWAYVWRAKIEHARGNLAEAIRAMHHSVRIDPASESSAIYLGLLYLELEDLERARPWLTHAASLNGDNSAALFWQGFIALAFEGKHPETLVALARDMSLLATTTYDLVPIVHAAQVAMGTPDDAIARISKRHPELRRRPVPQVSIGNASSAVALIYLLREQGETVPAQALLDAAFETAALFPSQFRWLGHDAELLALAGRTQDALAALQLGFESGWRVNRWMLEQSPALATLRDEPGFSDVLNAADLASNKQHARLLEMESSGELDGGL